MNEGEKIIKAHQCLSNFTDKDSTNSYFIYISHHVEIISLFSDPLEASSSDQSCSEIYFIQKIFVK